ncbi:1,2-dihydroxy-3-keto-5-methylthiopentene dioxygenase 1 [Glycine soja]|nr:hypothetical protein JHK86_048086 [Glycine max]KAG4944062.1 hypothetical protein JHK85_048708 [Glycine max]
MDDSNEDQRLPHHRNPNELVALYQLAELRVLCWKLHPTIYENDQELTKIREDMGYNYMVGDLIILLAGIYHHFTLDPSNFVKLFKGELVWTTYNRPKEDNPARKEYIKGITEKFGVQFEAH